MKKYINTLGAIGLVGLVIYIIIFINDNTIPSWPLFLLLSFLFIWMFSSKDSLNISNKEVSKVDGEVKKEKIYSGKYISGHIDIDDSKNNTALELDADSIKIFCISNSTLDYEYLSKIEYSKIEDVLFEDETSIQKRVGLKRMLVLGLFAFAVKKNEKKELAYLIIVWKEGKFKNETVFEFEGTNSIKSANSLRNRIIKNINN